jgi:uncharacterized protein YndB with AHSA1/START domain
MPNIRHELIIEAPAEKIYYAITAQDGLSSWWTPDTTARPEPDTIARFAFGPDYFKEMMITELRPDKLVRWNCINATKEWVGTNISFELESGEKKTWLSSHPELQGQIQQQKSDKGTLLIFHHDGWKEYTPMFAECNYTWALFLRSLKLLCETGKGRPWPYQHRSEG